jgi:hypothetical protein
LEGGWRVGETKENHCWFIQASVGDKCSLPLISFFDPYIVVSFIKKVWNSRERVCVFDSSFVDFSIVLGRP